MLPPNQHSRLNLIELKAQLIKRLGPERSKQYFYYLNKFFNLKISKIQFNKLCFRVIGKDNVRLHNLLICSILKNVCVAKALPTLVPSDYGVQSGDVLSSPLKTRSKVTARLLAEVDSASHASTITNDYMVSGNRYLTYCDIQKPLQHHQEVLGKVDNQKDALLHNPEKVPLTKGSVDGFLLEDRKDQGEVIVVEDGKELDGRNSLQAPLGIPSFSGSTRAWKALPSVRSGGFVNLYDIGVLLDSEALRERMQQIATWDGLGGVPMDCANLLNNGLDVYLKRLIRMCMELVGTRQGSNMTRNNIVKRHSYGKLVNAVLPIYHNQVQNNIRISEDIDKQSPHKLVSLLDFKVAMDLNPQELGEDWPLLLEEICVRSFKE